MISVLAAAIVGTVFLVAGATKLGDRARWAADAAALGAPQVIPPSLLTVVPYVEIALGAALVAQVARPFTALVALVVLAVFSALLVRVLLSGRRPACACFGAWSASPIGWGHVARNVGLMLLCLVARV